jgi:hypothetical protein
VLRGSVDHRGEDIAALANAFHSYELQLCREHPSSQLGRAARQAGDAVSEVQRFGVPGIPAWLLERPPREWRLMNEASDRVGRADGVAERSPARPIDDELEAGQIGEEPHDRISGVTLEERVVRPIEHVGAIVRG